MIFRIVCQISGQDNVSYKFRKSYGHFQIKKFCSCPLCFCFLLFQLEQKITVEIFVLPRVLFIAAISTIALLSENSTNALKVETRTKQSCKILNDILYLSFLDI